MTKRQKELLLEKFTESLYDSADRYSKHCWTFNNEIFEGLGEAYSEKRDAVIAAKRFIDWLGKAVELGK